MGNPLPTKYISTLPRVSQIVEYFYSFNGNTRQRFEDWLLGNDIGVDEYMKEASEGGTFVHSKLEDYLNGKVYKGRKYTGFINAGIDFIKQYKVKPIAMEEYISTDYYQGTMDLVGEIDGEQWILDWKTYGLAKYKFGLDIPSYKKPYDKLKKAKLQLSLYAMAKGIENIGVIELTWTGFHFHILEKIPNEQLIKLCKEYQLNYIDEL